MVQTLEQSSIDLPLYMIVIAIVSNDLTESNVTLDREIIGVTTPVAVTGRPVFSTVGGDGKSRFRGACNSGGRNCCHFVHGTSLWIKKEKATIATSTVSAIKMATKRSIKKLPHTCSMHFYQGSRAWYTE